MSMDSYDSQLGLQVSHPEDLPVQRPSTGGRPRVVTEDLPAKVDQVNHPSHYNSHASGIECIKITEHMNFCLGNAVKYIWRADLKNGIEDLEKAEWYIRREIERRKALGE